MAYVSGIRTVETGLFGRLADAATGLRANWQRYRVYRTTLRELGALSDRDLADLGIHRANIGAVAAEAAYGA